MGRLLAGLLLLMAATSAGCGDNEPVVPTPPAPFSVRAVSPTAGLPGQTVAIIGNGFQPQSVVTFGGMQTVSNLVTDERISATVPTLPAGAVDVVVRNPDGQRGTLPMAFTVEAVSTDNRTVSLTASPRTVEPGGELTVSWTVSARPSSLDWIGLFGRDVPSTSYQDGFWQYVGNGLSGTLVFRAPLQDGEYEFRYLLDDGFVDVARAPVTVR